uniref:Uncharacterized protein n=1 Tax=Tanacetum cinerariifolium TaxID=118510 RepID=A0A6L2L2A4_TANCI|nr:hypothetical protein [Tanacetum cinerariifolium]
MSVWGVDNRRITLIVIHARANGAVVILLMEFVQIVLMEMEIQLIFQQRTLLTNLQVSLTTPHTLNQSCVNFTGTMLEKSFKTYSNPLFDLDEEIISSEFNPIYNEDLDSTLKNDRFDTKSYLLESLLNRDTLMASTPNIDSLLENFSGELAHTDLIPPGIDEAKYDHEEDIHLVERLFDPFMEEIGLFLASDGSIPPGIDSDNLDSERDHLFLERLLHDDPIPLPDILDFSNVVRFFLPFFTYPVTSSILLSSGSEDTIFDPDVSNYHFSSLEPGVSHRSGTFMKFNVYPNHLNESPMEILSSTCFLMDQ